MTAKVTSALRDTVVLWHKKLLCRFFYYTKISHEQVIVIKHFLVKWFRESTLLRSMTKYKMIKYRNVTCVTQCKLDGVTNTKLMSVYLFDDDFFSLYYLRKNWNGQTIFFETNGLKWFDIVCAFVLTKS